ncbi:MAG: carboxypeptidase regulatory-like domain-containing protein [Bacteroidetes bacterium]|nr:carboxypeptidase regulatory-like domain-containing protein [Bacteroidota bacterium]
MKTLLILRRIVLPMLAFCLLALGAVLSSCEEPATGPGPSGGATVTGILNDEQGHIVPGATVAAIGASDKKLSTVVTNDEGAFAISGLPSDLNGVRLQVTHQDFKPYANTINEIISQSGGITGVLVNMMHADSCCATLTLDVTGTNGVPLANVEVRLRRGDLLITMSRTDSNGRVVFNNVCAGEYNIRLSRDGYAVLERGGITVHGCEPTHLEAGMHANGDNQHGADSCCRGYLRIIPKDSNGVNLSGATVRITKTGMNPRTLVSNGDGAIFHEMCDGTYVVHITKDGYRPIEFTVTLHCNDSVVTDRRMDHVPANNNDSCCNGRLQVNTHDSTTNANVNGASVVLRKAGVVVGTATSAEGHVVFEHLCTGDYTVVIEKDGYVRQEFTVHLDCNGHVEVTRSLAPSGGNQDTCCHGRITVTVRDSVTNAVLANTTVRIWKNGTLIATRTTDANGHAVFENLCAGTYAFDFSHDGYAAREMGGVTIQCNGTAEVSKQLVHNPDNCCTAVFRFHVKDSAVADGGWISGVTVTITSGNDTWTGTTNGDGTYVREALCGHKTYTITFSKDGFHTKSITIQLTDCRTAEETIMLTRL